MEDERLPTPAEQSYRMPAEWAPHAATWLSWPHNADTWPNLLGAVEAAMAEVVRRIAPGEDVHINVLDAAHAEHVARLIGALAPPERLVWHVLPTDDAWIRDHGAIFVCRPGAVAPLLALDFEFNAWGGKYPPYDRDRAVAAAMAEALGVPRYSPGIVLEGGSVDVDGAGLMVTTEQCLLHPNRNPGLGREELETVLRGAFGVERVLWLGSGVVGDDTDGHVDDVTRFVAPGRLVTALERDARDPNAAALAANRERLAALEAEPGLDLEVLELPMPPPLVLDGQRLPASYANFYVANDCVLVPAFGAPSDDEAASVLGGCFPGRRIARIDCRALVAGLGAVHCLTQQLPAPVAVLAGGARR